MSDGTALIMPVEVAGYARRLCGGLRAHGVDAEVIDLTGDPLAYGVPRPRGLAVRALVSMYRWRASRPRLVRAGVSAASLPFRVVAAVSIARSPRLIVCLSGRSLLGGWDLRLARRRGSRVISVFLGSDSRPPYLNGVLVNNEEVVDYGSLRRATRRTRAHVARVERVSDLIVCNPLSAQFLTKPFIDWFAIGMPIDVPESQRTARHRGGPLRVVHAPTRPRQKGSDAIEAAFARAVEQGVDATMRRLTGVPNDEVRTAIGEADLVIDELYSDSFLGGLGVEAAVANTPCLTFGYGGRALAALPGSARYPLQAYGHPASLDERVLRAMRDADWRAGLADEAARFVSERWSPADVAERYLTLSRGQVPDAWLLQPENVDYAWGFGVSEARLATVLRGYLARYGVDGLLLPSTSRALAALLRIAGGSPGDAAPAQAPRHERPQ